jgi:phage-related tail protein
VLTKGEPAILDDSPQAGEDIRSVPVELDSRAAKTVAALLALQSFELVHALGALYATGVNAGERSARSRPYPTA